MAINPPASSVTLVVRPVSGQVTDRAGDDADAVAVNRESAREFMMARAAGFVDGRKSLMDE